MLPTSRSSYAHSMFPKIGGSQARPSALEYPHSFSRTHGGSRFPKTDKAVALKRKYLAASRLTFGASEKAAAAYETARLASRYF